MTKFTSNKLNQANEDIISAFLTKYISIDGMPFTLTNKTVIESYLAYAKKLEKSRNDNVITKFIDVIENIDSKSVEKHAEVDEANL